MSELKPPVTRRPQIFERSFSITEMDYLDIQIALIAEHVDQGRRNLESQRTRVLEKRAGSGGAELLEAFERSQATIESDLERLILARYERDNRAHYPAKKRKSPKWTKQDDDRLVELKSAGKRPVVIAKEMKRTEASVLGRIGVLAKHQKKVAADNSPPSTARCQQDY